MQPSTNLHRRDFLKSTALFTSGTFGATIIPNATPADDRPNVIGPRDGFSPHLGTLLSMMSWMRETILYPVKGLTIEQLDYIHDEDSNSIGSMLLHLAATERY
ncbi:MAG TPA: hypothetical protein VGD40_18450, partial [Chryseosolibacter sp.]